MLNLNEVKNAFAEIISALSNDINELLPEDGISGMIKFYQNDEVEQCRSNKDNDMLLYQYGTYGFSGVPEFQINITRQLIIDHEDEPYQLQLTFYYPKELGIDISAFNLWWNDKMGISQFIYKVNETPAYKKCHSKRPIRVEYIFEQC